MQRINYWRPSPTWHLGGIPAITAKCKIANSARVTRSLVHNSHGTHIRPVCRQVHSRQESFRPILQEGRCQYLMKGNCRICLDYFWRRFGILAKVQDLGGRLLMVTCTEVHNRLSVTVRDLFCRKELGKLTRNFKRWSDGKDNTLFPLHPFVKFAFWHYTTVVVTVSYMIQVPCRMRRRNKQ